MPDIKCVEGIPMWEICLKKSNVFKTFSQYGDLQITSDFQDLLKKLQTVRKDEDNKLRLI